MVFLQLFPFYPLEKRSKTGDENWWKSSHLDLILISLVNKSQMIWVISRMILQAAHISARFPVKSPMFAGEIHSLIC